MGSTKELAKAMSKLKLPQFCDLDVSEQMEKPVIASITGTVPTWLKGSLYRNGSGLFKMGDRVWKHLFDGFSVIHRWTVKDGQVTFLSTILDTEMYKKSVKFNRLVGRNFGNSFPDPCKSIFSRFFSYFLPGTPEKHDNTAVSLVEFGDRLFALTETTTINEIKPETLLKKDQTDLVDTLALHMGTAHPHFCEDGSMFYYGTKMDHKQAYNIVHVPPPPKDGSPFAGAKIVASVPSQWKMNIGYTHSFGMTENYFIHFEQPLSFNVFKLLTVNMRGGGICDTLNSYPSEQINIHVVSKETGKDIPIVYKAPHGFLFHFINCYEDSGHVVCDVCLFNDGTVMKELYLESTYGIDSHSKQAVAYFARFVLPLSLDKAKEGTNLVTLPGTTATATLRKGTRNILDVTCDKMFGEKMMELPRINYSYNTRKYRYCYGSTAFYKARQAIMKCDVEQQTMTEWLCDENHIPGEPVFVPRPGASQEDDGVVLCPILANTTEHSSFLVILDAHSFKEVARATTPTHTKITCTFHGVFVDKAVN